MMVPRSFKYGAVSSPAVKEFDEKQRKNSYKSPTSLRTAPGAGLTPTVMARRPISQKYTATAPVAPTPTKPVEIPERTRQPTSPKSQSQSIRKTSTTPSVQCADGVPTSVAALLAMTTIPPRKSDRVRRRRRTTGTPATISIGELVNHWKSDDSLRPSLASSPTMSILLEDVDNVRETVVERRQKSDTSVPRFYRGRSTSTESVPSLDGDECSSLSVRSPSTPGSLRSRRSLSNLKREKFKSASLGEDCLFDHPLIMPSTYEPHEDDNSSDNFLTIRDSRKSRSSFRSNLTTSLQALRKAALNSITSLTSSSGSSSSGRSCTGPGSTSSQIDDALWSHPFLFPRLSSEIRPAIQGTPTKAQRRYLNPMPLTFEEQEAPFQKALHAPYLAQAVDDVPTIQLQTYTRGRRGASKNRGSAGDSQSEAGRAQLLTMGIRQREPRENADFLRVVVLEMNMRRAGKLETGRARIWLPPRQVSERGEESRQDDRVPVRWRGICAC